MELNLQKLLRGTDYPVEGSEQYDFSDRDFSQFAMEGPVLLAYHAQHETGGVQLTIGLAATVLAACARCLGDIRRAWRVDKTYHISAADMREEFPDLPFTPAGGIDLEELAYGELVLEVDSVLLCKPDCAGLCPECGQRKAECRCGGASAEEAADTGDPRLQILKQLLTDDEPQTD